jgi:hypothetical protein
LNSYGRLSIRKGIPKKKKKGPPASANHRMRFYDFYRLRLAAAGAPLPF